MDLCGVRRSALLCGKSENLEWTIYRILHFMSLKSDDCGAKTLEIFLHKLLPSNVGNKLANVMRLDKH